MPGNAIPKIHPPRKRSRQTIGKISKSRSDGAKTPDEHPENNPGEKENSRRYSDRVSVFIRFGGDNPAKERPGNRF